jgi:PKD repeat protein
MRSSHALALLLGITELGTACSQDGNSPSNTPPAAAFTPSCAFLVCTFANGSSDEDGQVTAYNWDFGDGAAAATTKDAQHTYSAANTYTVSLTVTDNDGAANGVTKSVQVSAQANAPPSADFTSSCTELACSFTDLSNDGDGTVVGFHWDFGDGTEAATQNSTHAYASAGTYVVVLTVTDDSGAASSLSHQVSVTGPQASGQATIGLSPTRLSFIYYVLRRLQPPSQTLTIANLGGGALTWTATSSRWLKISPKTGTAPSTVTVSVDPAALPIGINGYRPPSLQGSITVSAVGASNTPQNVPVSLVLRYF